MNSTTLLLVSSMFEKRLRVCHRFIIGTDFFVSWIRATLVNKLFEGKAKYELSEMIDERILKRTNLFGKNYFDAGKGDYLSDFASSGLAVINTFLLTA